MEGFNQERRGLFDGLKVPFDVKAILLAAGGLLLFWAGVKAMEALWPLEGVAADRGLLEVIAGSITVRLGHPGRLVAGLCGIANEAAPVHTGTWVFFFIWCAVVWSFFAGAICRIAAMKIAREESLELRDAVKFGASKFLPNLLSIAFVAAIISFFYVICNATIAGLIGRIPYIGDLLVALLYVLVLLSSFFVVFTAALGVLGFNLGAAAIATEASDTFDGVSRAWNYIIARPWHVLFTYSLSIVYIAVFLFFGNLFLKVSVKSLGVRWWGMSHDARVYKPAGRDLAAKIGVLEQDEARLPGKAEYLYKRLILKTPGWTDDGPLLYPQKIGPDGKPTDYRDVWPALEGTLYLEGGVICFWLALAQLFIYAYAVAYFLSAQTTIYFLLRKEVEGDDYTEINLEDEDDGDEGDFDLGAHEPKHGDAPKPAAPAPGPAKPLPIVTSGGGGDKKADGPAAGGDKHEHDHPH